MTGQPTIRSSRAKLATQARWAAAIHPLGRGRLGVATDTGVWKLGDGETLWNALPTVPGGGGGGTAASTTYDNTSSGLAGDDVQEALDEVAAGGGGGAGPGDVAILAANGGYTNVNSNATVYPPFDGAVLDPGGWLGSGDYESPDWWGDTFPDKTWVALPDGVYWVEMNVSWDLQDPEGDPFPTTGRLYTLFEDVDNRINTPGFDDFYSTAGPKNTDVLLVPGYPTIPGFGGKFPVCKEIVRVKDDNGPMVFAPIVQNATTVHLKAAIQLQIIRISSAGG